MRETLSKRPREIVKATVKTAKTTVSAKEKLRSTSKSKPSSVSKPPARTATKPKTVTTKPSKPAKKVAIAKKTVAKPAKTAIKKTAPVKAIAKAIAKRNDSTLKAKAAKVKETKAKGKETKGKGKASARSTTSAKPTPKPAVRVQPGKVITKPKRKLALPVHVAPPPPEPPRRTVTSGALRAFEHSVRVFNRRHFEEAKSLFEALLSKFPAEVELIARSQMYIQVCSQKVAQVQTTPRNADELYDHGVYALNIGDFTQAKTFFEKALRLKPDEAHLLYSLAATHAQTGSMDQALDYLKRTLQIQPRYRFQALNDSDFSGLRENKQFLELIGLASPFDLLQSRR